ncbi:MAG: T9SS type A sorting domain-containing protein, partial [Saprospiraceae bacterium]|nr:T9SS type A sorting domain-containing protein [Saprospiraceae bacterium]
DFSLRLELLPISGAPGLQSFAITEWQGHWLLMGGRKDGLHQRQPFAAFDEAGQNDRVYVLHPETGQSWSAPLTSLPAAIAEQLSSTNLEFSRKGDVLYLIGGYGYSATAAEHITHPQLLAVQVSGLIQAIQQGASDLKPYFLALNDQRMAVTGGQLAELGGAFYLVGGQRFDGRYNPMNHPTFTQTYTDAIRIFTIENTGASLSIGNYREWKNADQLHRRDYNMAAQIFPNGQPGLTAFSGVFQVAQDVPWLHPVDIDTSGYTPQPAFFQYLNHYHCAHAQLYQAGENQMHTVFFGGMAQYTLDAAGQLVQDDNVPFVRTIARVTRFADGRLEEVKLPVELPELLGAGAEFIPNPGLPAYANGVLRMDEFSGDSVLLGYIFGGIKSPQANIFFTNIPSAATPAAYRVWWRRPTSAVHEQAVANPLRLLVTPNPTSGELLINYQLEEKQAVRIRIFHASGRLLGEFDEGAPAAGPHFLKLETSGMPNGYLIVQLQAGNQQSTRKILLE